MKAISIKQPWAWLIANGYKPIENRVWYTNYTGILLIHASSKYDDNFPNSYLTYYHEIHEAVMKTPIPKPNDLEFGGFVGIANMVDCVRKHESIWFQSGWGFVFSGARPFKLVEYPGRLKIFEVDRDPQLYKKILISLSQNILERENGKS